MVEKVASGKGKGDRGGKEVDLRFTRALGTAEVLAICTFGRFSNEGCIALVARSAYAMDWDLPHDLVAGEDFWHHEQLRFRPWAWIWCRIDNSSGNRLRRCGLGLGLSLGLSLLVLRRLAREARTFLAAGMRAVAAHFLGAEGDLAAMTLTMDAHTHCLLHPSRITFPDWCPLAGLQCQAPF